MLKKILAVLAAIGGVFSTVFFLLFKQSAKDKKIAEEKAQKATKTLNANIEAQKAENEVKKENEKKKERIYTDNKLDAFNACNECLQDN